MVQHLVRIKYRFVRLITPLVRIESKFVHIETLFVQIKSQLVRIVPFLERKKMIPSFMRIQANIISSLDTNTH